MLLLPVQPCPEAHPVAAVHPQAGICSCHIWQLLARLKDTVAVKFWNDVLNLPELDILFSLTAWCPLFRHLHKHHFWQVLE